MNQLRAGSVLCVLLLMGVLALTSTAFCQDLSPLKDYNIWLPMTGTTESQIDDAKEAGYDTVMLKIHPPLVDNSREIDFGSADESANEHDMWGPYDSSNPQNDFTTALMKNILDYANVDYRVRNPLPRGVAPFLGDHMEQASISANIVYNNMDEPRTLTVRTPFRPKGYETRLVEGRYETEVTVPPFSYVALQSSEDE